MVTSVLGLALYQIVDMDDKETVALTCYVSLSAGRLKRLLVH